MKTLIGTFRGLGLLWDALRWVPVDGTAGEDEVNLHHEGTAQTDRPDSVNDSLRYGDRTGITAAM